jgi:hypothetical protein
MVWSRSTRSALNTNRTYFAATWSPQPVIAVAAIFASSRRIRDASAGSKPSEATSRRSDQPPAGLTNGQPGEAGKYRVAAALELGDAHGDVALVAAQDGRCREARDRHRHCDVGEPVAVKAPAVLIGEEGDEARNTPGEPNAVDDARVRGVGDNHLVSGIDGAEEHVEKRS